MSSSNHAPGTDPRASRSLRGGACERAAERHLVAQGLQLVARNFRCRAGELDLICRDAGILVIVEVRQRTRGDFGGALASVTRAKQRRIVRATQYFLLREPRWRSFILRFDVIAWQGGVPETAAPVWIPDAFRPG